MNRQRAKELLPIHTAWANGEDIQYRKPEACWHALPPVITAWSDDYEYRIKPKPAEIWVEMKDGEPYSWHPKPHSTRFDKDLRLFREVTE